MFLVVSITVYRLTKHRVEKKDLSTWKLSKQLTLVFRSI